MFCWVKCFVLFFLVEPKGSIHLLYKCAVAAFFALHKLYWHNIIILLLLYHDKLVYIFVGTTVSLAFCYIFEIYICINPSTSLHACRYLLCNHWYNIVFFIIIDPFATWISWNYYFLVWKMAIVVAAFFVLTMVSWLLFVLFTLFVINYVLVKYIYFLLLPLTPLLITEILLTI